MIHSAPTSLKIKRCLSLISAAVTLLSVAWLNQVNAESTLSDPTEIMRAVQDRETGDRSSSTITLEIRDKNNSTRVRTVKSIAMDFEGGTQQIMYFMSPQDIRGTGLLSRDYDGDRSDDQWLHLPSLHKTTRISSGERSGSFMGTDLSYADMTQPDLKDYKYCLLYTSPSPRD